MQNPNAKLHYYQKALVKKLTLSSRGKKFNDLIIRGLESEHMNYHLKKLLSLGLVEKSGPLYKLTDIGKDYANLLDDTLADTERLPKTSIIIKGIRKKSKGEIEELFNRRLRQPYYGKVGRLTGKVHFGEALKEAAARELYEETGLRAKTFTLEEIYRKIRKREDGTFVQDVVFFIFFVTNFSGKLIAKTPFQENFWATEKNLRNKKKYDLYDDFRFDFSSKPKRLTIRENIAIAEGF